LFKGTCLADTNPAPDAPAWNIRTVGEVVAIYLGIVVTLAYPVGFATLVLQMLTNYSFDFSLAIQAAYLVPIPQVIAKILVVLRFAIFPMMATLMYFFIRQFFPTYSTWRRAARRFSLLFLIYAVLLYTPYSYAFTFTSASFLPWGGLVFLTYALIGGAVMLFGVTALTEALEAQSLRAWRLNTTLIILGAIVAAVFLAGVMNPSLPIVQLKLGEKEQEVTLLSHANGYWHLIDEQRNLVSLTDDEAGEGRYLKGRSNL
jgi:hypothetical protein